MAWRELWGRLQHRETVPGQYLELPRPHPQRPSDPAIVVDGNTRSFWARGEVTSATLIEVEDGFEPRTQRPITALLQGETPAEAKPRGNPAFSEATFVELLRAGRYKRAYDMIAPDCQAAWGSWMAFADAHRGGALEMLSNIDVTEQRILESWSDPAQGVTHEHVAELEVAYTFAKGEQSKSVQQTVHLVGVDGRWRSLSYPPHPRRHK